MNLTHAGSSIDPLSSARTSSTREAHSGGRSQPAGLRPGITHLCLDVTDVDDEYARLTGLGVRFLSSPQDLGAGIRSVYSRDPDGNVVELHELASGSHPVALP